MLSFVDPESLYNLVNKGNLVHNFSQYVYFFSLHVSGDDVPIIRRNNCIYVSAAVIELSSGRALKSVLYNQQCFIEYEISHYILLIYIMGYATTNRFYQLNQERGGILSADAAYGNFDYSFQQIKTVYVFHVRQIVYAFYQGKFVHSFH